VRPAFPRDDVGNMSPRHWKIARDGLVGFAKRCSGADFIDIANGYFRIKMRFPMVASSFIAHVAHVVSMATDKEMRWIDARSVIAFVANEHSSRYRPINLFVRQAVRELFWRNSSRSKEPVSNAVFVGRPIPTFFVRQPPDFRPEARIKHIALWVTDTSMSMREALVSNVRQSYR
jgi:hypothetical protein